MRGTDAVAIILAVALAVSLVLFVQAVVYDGFVPSGDGVLGAAVGALLVVLARYLHERPQ